MHGELEDDDADLESLLSWPEGKALRNEIVYSRRADRITIQKGVGNVVAMIDIASTGNKTEFAEFRRFVEQAAGFVAAGVHLLVVDLHPSDEFPEGVHKAIWDEIHEEDYEPPAGKPLTVASYHAGPEQVAYVDALAVGDSLPDAPLFVRSGYYVPVPLEATYQDAWSKFPAVLRSELD